LSFIDAFLADLQGPTTGGGLGGVGGGSCWHCPQQPIPATARCQKSTFDVSKHGNTGTLRSLRKFDGSTSNKISRFFRKYVCRILRHVCESDVVQKHWLYGVWTAVVVAICGVRPIENNEAKRKYTHGMSTRDEHGVTVVDTSEKWEIWDGADLSPRG